MLVIQLYRSTPQNAFCHISLAASENVWAGVAWYAKGIEHKCACDMFIFGTLGVYMYDDVLT